MQTQTWAGRAQGRRDRDEILARTRAGAGRTRGPGAPFWAGRNQDDAGGRSLRAGAGRRHPAGLSALGRGRARAPMRAPVT